MINDKPYVIGYKKPPQTTRFKKGHSGNPSGRKRKKTPTFNNTLSDELNSKIAISENGKKRNITKLEAIIKKSVNDSMQGKVASLLKLMEFYAKHHFADETVEPVKIMFVKTEDFSKKTDH